MDASERLAALLAGELDTDERDALVGELARDPELRNDLEAMRTADTALRNLSSPAPREGFEDRLDRAVGDTLRELLAPEPAPDPEVLPDASAGSTVVFEEAFAARRRARDARRMRTLVGVAAGAVVLVGSGVVLTQLGGSDDAGESADDSAMTALDDSGASADTESAEEPAESARALVDAPIVVDDARELDAEALDALLASGELGEVGSAGLDRSAGSDLAQRFQSALGAGGAGEAAAAPEADAPDSDEETEEDAETPELESDGADELAPAGPALTTRDGRPLSDDASRDVARCLDELLEAEPAAIPVYTELATYDGVDAVVFGLVTADRTSGAFTRTEVWALERSTCRVLRFSQG